LQKIITSVPGLRRSPRRLPHPQRGLRVGPEDGRGRARVRRGGGQPRQRARGDPAGIDLMNLDFGRKVFGHIFICKMVKSEFFKTYRRQTHY
jgi:hypothetical protein